MLEPTKEEIKERLEWFKERGLVLRLESGTHVFTMKFNQLLGEGGMGIVTDKLEVRGRIRKKGIEVELGDGVKVSSSEVPWMKVLTKIVLESRIPSYSYNGRGEPYEIKRVTKNASDAFRKAIESGFDYTLLVDRMRKYYQQTPNKFKVKLETYLEQQYYLTDKTEDNDSSFDTRLL